MQNYDNRACLAMQFIVYNLISLTLYFGPFISTAQNLSYYGGPTIVLDPGHGGQDDGAKGKDCSEKQITLAVCKKVQGILAEKLPKAAVYFTRESDVFVALHERARIANDLDAELFISVHCNAVPSNQSKVRGTETYVMGLHKARENLEVARRENNAIALEHASDIHYKGIDFESPESFIVLNHIQDQHLQKSITLAKSIESEFDLEHPGHSKGVKQAGFHVLHQVSMPAVLIECGYMTHPEEVSYLCSAKGQQELAEMIARGIVRYFSVNPIYPSIAMQDIQSKAAVKSVSEESLVIYKIQLAAAKNKPAQGSVWYSDPNYEILQEDGAYKLVYGSFISQEDANEEKERMKQQGFKDAFIIKFKEDQKQTK
ncbi:MAG: N-acetylmuramoyl-L-alanine amidase [Saprospiraceae bacterium]|nr:N-acetylmuramoyl-L-alanine amidase [Saprospiraceae bacterium]